MFENKERKPLFNACFEAYQKFLQDAKVDHCETGLGGYDAMVEAFGKKGYYQIWFFHTTYDYCSRLSNFVGWAKQLGFGVVCQDMKGDTSLHGIPYTIATLIITI